MNRLSILILLVATLAAGCASRSPGVSMEAAENAARVIALNQLTLSEAEKSRIRSGSSSKGYVDVPGKTRFTIRWKLPSGSRVVVRMDVDENGLNVFTAEAEKKP